MRRLLQGLALVQIFLVVALAYRMVGVWTTPLPQFPEVPELPAETPLPPAKEHPPISEAVTASVVEHDLFDEQRGDHPPETAETPVDLTPVLPPSTVKLMGVMLLTPEPVAILLDTNVKPEQQAVRKGDMFGEYEVGYIGPQGITLLGNVPNQQYQIPLRIDAAAGAAPGAPPPAAPAARNPAAAARAAAAAPPPPVQAPHSPAHLVPPGTQVFGNRPGQGAAGAAAANKPGDKNMSARERAQAIAQRNADLRKSAGRPNAEAADQEGSAQDNQQGAAPDPVQARLEALRQLREAAKTH